VLSILYLSVESCHFYVCLLICGNRLLVLCLFVSLFVCLSVCLSVWNYSAPTRWNDMKFDISGVFLTPMDDDFGDLVVRMLASCSRVRGFKPDRSRWIFLYIKILSMPSEGKLNNLSHVPTLWHVKEPRICSKLRLAS
jgi:hypothetical protein